MSGAHSYFTELYLSTPCERDANAFAYRSLKAAEATGHIDALYDKWSPKFLIFREEDALDEFFKAVTEIDHLLKQQI